MHNVTNAKEFSKGLVLTFCVEILKAASNTEVYLTFRTVSHNFCVFVLATWCFTIVTHNTSAMFG